jgi:hypothetical protein
VLAPIDRKADAGRVPAGPDMDAFEPEGQPDADLDDLLDVGRAPPRWLGHVSAQWARLRYGTPLLVCAALVVTGIVAWTTVEHGNSPAAAPSTVLTRGRPPFNSAPLIAVRGLAHQAGPLFSYVRQSTPVGACALVKPGHSPLPLISRAIHRIVPRFRVMDSATVLDQFTGLCAVQVRAKNRVGDVLVVSIASPTEDASHWTFDRMETGIAIGPGPTTLYALNITTRGFRILVGATGPDRGLPGSDDLLRLANARAMMW